MTPVLTICESVTGDGVPVVCLKYIKPLLIHERPAEMVKGVSGGTAPVKEPNQRLPLLTKLLLALMLKMLAMPALKALKATVPSLTKFRPEMVTPAAMPL